MPDEIDPKLKAEIDKINPEILRLVADKIPHLALEIMRNLPKSELSPSFQQLLFHLALMAYAFAWVGGYSEDPFGGGPVQ